MFLRLRFVLGLAVLFAVASLSAAGQSPAGSNTVTPTRTQSAPCPPTSGRLYCVDLTTYNGLARSGGVEVDLQIENWDGSTLTNPVVALSWTSLGTGLSNLQFTSSSPSLCAGGTAAVTCSFPNIAGIGPASPAGPPNKSQLVRLFFTAAADAGVSGVSFTAAATAKESSNDNPGAANPEVQTATGSMSFGNDPATSATFALGGNRVKLNALLSSYNGSTDSVQFAVPPGTNPFLAQFATTSGAACFPGIQCTGLQLTTDLSGAPAGTFSSQRQILWQASINSTTANVDAVHYYDPVSVTASAPKTLTTAGTSFAACDGVNFGGAAPAGLSPNTDYFVVNAVASGGSTSFQVATTAKGKPLSFTRSGTFSASCIRVIGDQKSETTTSCDPASPPSQSPALFAAKETSSTVKVCLWDSANGHIGY